MKKSGKILIVVLCLIILGLATFIVVDKFILTKKDDKSINEESDIVIADNSNTILKDNTIDINTNNSNSTSNSDNDKVSKEQEISQNQTTNINKNMSSNDYKYAEEYIKIIDNVTNDTASDGIKCDLIYFNNDDIPDLVIDISGCVSLYMYENGNVYNLMENEVYGIGSCKYYDYQEKNGVIYTYGNGYAGAIQVNTYYILNSNKKFDELCDIGEGAEIESTNENYEQIQKELKETSGYYYNDKKISEQEYNNKLEEFSIDADLRNFKGLAGIMSPEEVKKHLSSYQ